MKQDDAMKYDDDDDDDYYDMFVTYIDNHTYLDETKRPASL